MKYIKIYRNISFFNEKAFIIDYLKLINYAKLKQTRLNSFMYPL